MILDIIVIGLIVLFVILGISKGAARMILGVLTSFVSFLAASWLGKLLAGLLYNAFCAPAVDNAVRKSLDSVGDITKNLPWWAEKALNLSGKEFSAADSASQLPDLVNSAVKPIAAGIMTILLTLILFLVINLLLHKLVLPLILKVFRLPLISSVDKLVGGLIGAVEAVLIICILAYLLKLILPYINTDGTFLNETTIYNSFIFYHFYSGNIFSILTSWI